MPNKSDKPGGSDNELPKPDKDIKLSMSSREPEKNDRFEFTGNIHGGVMAVGEFARAARYIDSNANSNLAPLLDQLFSELTRIPQESENDAAVITVLLQEVLETSELESPNKRKALTLKTEALRQVSEQLSIVAPNIALLVLQIIKELLKEE